jgi:hypothetical protein
MPRTNPYYIWSKIGILIKRLELLEDDLSNRKIYDTERAQILIAIRLLKAARHLFNLKRSNPDEGG